MRAPVFKPLTSERTSPPVKPAAAHVSPLARLISTALLGGLNALPRAWQHRLARLIGALAFGVGIRRQVALENLRAAFPEWSADERHKLARRAYANMALAALESLTARELSDSHLDQSVVVENWPAVQSAIDAGKGVLVATAHFGSWELFGAVMARRGMKLNVVVRPLKGAINAKIVEARQEAGIRLILQRGALTKMLQSLARGEVVAQLVDQVVPAKQGVFVPFFGRLASTTQALSMAARRSGAPVFVMMSAREGERLRVFAEGPIPMPQSGDARRDLHDHVAAVTVVIEKYIRRYPDQWLWLHRRWKVQPPELKG